MSIFSSKVAVAITPASIFAAHYEFLLGWALRFSHGNRTAAEDLVQETFIIFVTSREKVENPEDAKPLLWKYLNYVHGAELRRTQRHPFQSMTTIEFDSLQMSLREHVAPDSIDVQDELRNIMSYLCWRKETLKPASILLLRFFYAYSASEMTKICLMSRQSIDHGLSTAREEVREHIRSANRLNLVKADGPPPPAFKHMAVPADELLEELEATLASAQSTPCLPPEKLLAHYKTKPQKALPCSLLAHLVSCRECLDLVHAFYRFPDTSDRGTEARVHLMDPPEASDGRKKGVRSSPADMGRLQGVANQRSREVLEHRPRSLTLIVNGEAVATQDVGSSMNTQRVEWKPEKTLDFIEVESEQGVSLVVMPVHALPPNCPPEIHYEVELNDGRSIQVVLIFGTAYSIEVTYCDPHYFSTLTVEARRLYDVELFSDAVYEDEGFHLLEGGWTANAEDVAPAPRAWKLPNFFRWIKMPEFNPVFATAVVLGVASVLCFLIWTKWRSVPISANEMLVRAESWDSSSQGTGSPGVVRQKVRIVTAQEKFERTLYRDAQGIRQPRQEKSSPRIEMLKAQLASAGVDWKEPLSASTYQEWHDHQHVRRDSITRSGEKLLTLTTTTPSGPIVKESITIREIDFHPIGRTIEFRDSGTVQIAELEYEVLPWTKASPDWFEPLTPSITEPPRSPRASTLVGMPPALTDTQLDIAELQTRLVFGRLNEDERGRFELVRTSHGIEVKGIIATADRKEAVERDLKGIPHVVSEIYTFSEMEDRPEGGGQATSVATATVTESASPLQVFLLARGWSRDRIGSLTQNLFVRSASIERETRELNDLEARFRQPERLEDQARAALEVLLAEHRSSLKRELQAEQGLLAAIGTQPAGPAKSTPDSTTAGKADPVTMAKANRTLCNELLTGTSEQPRGADVIIPSIAASLSQIEGELTATNDVPLEPQASASASSLTHQRKQ